MRDLYEILRKKEGELARLQKEVEAIRITTRVLEEESANDTPDPLDSIIAPALHAAVASTPVPATPVPVAAGGNGGGTTKPSSGMYSAAWGNSLKEFP